MRPDAGDSYFYALWKMTIFIQICTFGGELNRWGSEFILDAGEFARRVPRAVIQVDDLPPVPVIRTRRQLVAIFQRARLNAKFETPIENYLNSLIRFRKMEFSLTVEVSI